MHDFCVTLLGEMGMLLVERLMLEMVMDDVVWSTRPFDLESEHINRYFDFAATCYGLLFFWVVAIGLPCRPQRYIFS